MTTELDEIRKFIIDQGERLNMSMCPLDSIEEVFRSQGYEREDTDNPLNGWEVSFWFSFSHPTKARYSISGSLWHGDFKIYKDEENTIEEG